MSVGKLLFVGSAVFKFESFGVFGGLVVFAVEMIQLFLFGFLSGTLFQGNGLQVRVALLAFLSVVDLQRVGGLIAHSGEFKSVVNNNSVNSIICNFIRTIIDIIEFVSQSIFQPIHRNIRLYN